MKFDCIVRSSFNALTARSRNEYSRSPEGGAAVPCEPRGAARQGNVRARAPGRENIAAPDLPTGLEWIGAEPDSMPALTAGGPAIVHFIDFAQLNSVRTLPYWASWARRYREAGLSVIGVQTPRFGFGADREAVAAGLERLGVEFPVAIDADRDLWHLYGCEGWPSLFLWAMGGALTWVHFGEGEYLGTEMAIQEELREVDALRALPEPMAPLRPRRRRTPR